MSRKCDNPPLIFDDFLVFIAEANLSKVGSPLDELMVYDHNLKFLKKIMKEDDPSIAEEYKNVKAFFLTKYGIDLDKFVRKDNGWFQGEHRFMPFFIDPKINYRVYNTKYNLHDLGEVREGGFVLMVGHPGIVAHGNYGGNDGGVGGVSGVGGNGNGGGKLIPAGSLILFGYYNLIFKDCSTRVFHYRSYAPIHSDLENIYPVKLDIWDPLLKKWGKADGTSATTITDHHHHVSLRNVITIPGRIY